MISSPARVPVVALLLIACRPETPPQPVDGPPSDLLAASRSLFSQYERALQTGARERLASFYHVEGAHVIFNGQARFRSRALIDSLYRYHWGPPAYFAWDSLQFEALPPTSVVAFGRFRWLRPADADTEHFAYVAVLEAVDSGMAIRLEHETRLRP